MSAPFIGAQPVVTIAGQSFDSPAIWHWITRTLEAGGTVRITDQNPEVATFTGSGDSGDAVTPAWSRQFNPLVESVGPGPLWIWCHPAGRDWSSSIDAFQNIQGENNIVPLYQSPTQKYGGVKIVDGVPTPIQPWSGSGAYWRDFAKAVVLVGGVAFGLSALVAPAAPIAAVAPSEWTIATAGMGEGMGSGGLLAGVAPTVPVVGVTPSEWAAATAGMGEGMGSGGFLPATFPTAPTLSQIGSAVNQGVQAVVRSAESVVKVAAAVETVRAVADGVVPQSVTAENQAGAPAETATPKPDNTLLYAGIGALLLVALKG